MMKAWQVLCHTLMWNLYFSVTFNSYFGLDVNLHQGVPSHPLTGMTSCRDCMVRLACCWHLMRHCSVCIRRKCRVKELSNSILTVANDAMWTQLWLKFRTLPIFVNQNPHFRGWICLFLQMECGKRKAYSNGTVSKS
jgi:hypothetical protein